MPPAKRKAAAANGVNQPKKVRIEESEPTEIPTTASGRPKRESTGEPNYRIARPKLTAVEKAANESTVKNPSKATKGPSPPKKRGRPPKNLQSKPATPTNDGKGVGRPPKNLQSKPAKLTENGKGVGRPPKSENKTSSPTELTSSKSARLTFQQATKTNGAVTATPSGRNQSTGVQAPSSTRGRGRPAKGTKTILKSDIGLAHEEDLVNDDAYPYSGEDEAEEEISQDEDRQYWLMKAEPEPRLVNGHDVSFSIDDLASASLPEPWDGVRNPVARNHMRAMRKGDLAFFYHSNCAVPGVVGIMKIVQEHAVDESAFEKGHPYYDEKSDRNKPKWECVHVEFMKKFENMVTLKTLRTQAEGNGPLKNMATLRQSRLSVSPVSRTEWLAVLEMAGEEDIEMADDEEEDVEVDDDKEGQEASVDGKEEDIEEGTVESAEDESTEAFD